MFKTHLRVIWISPELPSSPWWGQELSFSYLTENSENFQFLHYSCHIIFLHEVNFKVHIHQAALKWQYVKMCLS